MGRELDCGSGANVDDAGAGGAPQWVPQFLAGLIVTGSVKRAVAEAGIDFDAAWGLRRRLEGSCQNEKKKVGPGSSPG